MLLSALTSKGQTTIPVAIRTHFDLHTGDKIAYSLLEDGRVLLTPVKTDIRALKGMLPRPKKPFSLKQMEAAIRKGASEGC